jgi:hypothetical protein
MNISSAWSVVIIILGATAFTLGNINYNRAVEREKQQAASQKALSMLEGECRNNLAHISTMRPALTASQITTETFETTAWNIVSSGGLLVQVEKNTLAQLAEIYYLIGLADKYQSQILDLSTGVASALGSSGQLRQQYMGFLKSTLDKLEPKLHDVLAKATTH